MADSGVTKPVPAAANYETVPLEYDEIGVAAAQMNPGPVDARNPAKGIKANLERMLFLCEQANLMASAWPRGKAHLAVFPEFTLTGYDFTWSTRDFLNVALDIEGEEIAAIGRKAKEQNLYIAFASHTREKDWPGHYFNCSMIVAPSGKLIHKHWKAYGSGPGAEFGTTVHDVMDEFVERCGIDAVWPVARTPIGNLATYTCAEGFQPETARAFAFKGAEIICRCIGGGGHLNKAGKYMLQFRADCAASDVYGVFSNGGSGPTFKDKGCAENAFGGGSMVVDYFGRVLNEAHDSRETIVFEKIPVAAYRKRHERPTMRTELFALGYQQCPGKYPPNLYSDYGVPESAAAAIKLANEHARW